MPHGMKPIEQRTMMIAAIVHVSFSSAAGPTEALGPILVELLFTAVELSLKFTLEIVRLLQR